jgi:hypothetical protein
MATIVREVSLKLAAAADLERLVRDVPDVVATEEFVTNITVVATRKVQHNDVDMT